MSRGIERARDPREAALERHLTPQTLPDDFAEFWRDTLAEAGPPHPDAMPG